MDTITIRTTSGIETREGHNVESGLFGIYAVSVNNRKAWTITDNATGMRIIKEPYATLKDAKSAGVKEALENLTKYQVGKPEAYAELVSAFNKATGKDVTPKAKTDKGEKKMAKATKNTGAKKSASTKKTASKASDKNAALEKENKALKKELEILKKQIEKLTEVEKTNIDTFDIENYMNTRDNTNRITDALVEALENTDGLIVTRKGEDKWLYVSGKTEADTKTRKDAFKAMGFRWSGKECAWFLAPYPLANGKRYAARKARKASANA